MNWPNPLRAHSFSLSSFLGLHIKGFTTLDKSFHHWIYNLTAFLSPRLYWVGILVVRRPQGKGRWVLGRMGSSGRWPHLVNTFGGVQVAGGCILLSRKELLLLLHMGRGAQQAQGSQTHHQWNLILTRGFRTCGIYVEYPSFTFLFGFFERESQQVGQACFRLTELRPFQLLPFLSF